MCPKPARGQCPEDDTCIFSLFLLSRTDFLSTVPCLLFVAALCVQHFHQFEKCHGFYQAQLAVNH